MSDRLESGGWIFQVVPAPGESFGHYLGRFRRANCLSRKGFAELVTIDVRMMRGWEMPSLGQSPSAAQLAEISALLGLSVAQMTSMLPRERSQAHLATRLCPACYADVPIHQSRWQWAELDQCERHHQPFLTACPACSTVFRLPALWENGCCERCWLPFREMHEFSIT